MNQYSLTDYTIEVLDEPTYTLGSADNTFHYAKHYFNDDSQLYEPSSKHGIKIIQEHATVNSCIVMASGGATGVHENSSVLDNDQLVVCCSDTVFCLTVPLLELKWKVKADQATCFKILKYQEDYIIHGELQITKLDKNGNKLWEFGGADIFVSMDGEEEMKLEADGILLTDFEKTKYKIDYDGNYFGILTKDNLNARS